MCRKYISFKKKIAFKTYLASALVKDSEKKDEAVTVMSSLLAMMYSEAFAIRRADGILKIFLAAPW